MTGREQAVSSDELHAYVDNALDSAQRARVEAHLAAHPEDAELVRSYQGQNAALRALGASLDGAARKPALRLRSRTVRWRAVQILPWAAAVAGLLVLGGAGGWWARSMVAQPPREELYHLAAVAYDTYGKQQRHPVEVWANERDHLEKWLGNCLNAHFVAPELAQDGYELLGGRLLSNVQGAAALLLYQAKDSQRVALYVAQTSIWGNGKPIYEEVGPLATFTWQQGPLWYSLAGNLKADQLKAMALSVNRQVALARALPSYAVATRP